MTTCPLAHSYPAAFSPLDTRRAPVSAVDKQAARTPAGKWNKHVDAWDAIQDNEFFSPEAFAFVLKQLFQVAKPPDRFTPEYCIMKKFKDWEIRRRAPPRPHFP